MRRRVIGALAGVAVLLMVANLSASAAAPTDSSTGGLPQHGPPTQMLGLVVQRENIKSTLAGEKRPLYVDQVGLYSFRETSKLLQATLEIAHFRSLAPASSTDFQASIVNEMSSSLPTVVRVGGRLIYVTTSKGLTIAVWFRDGFMLALSIRNTYTKPKELVRAALAINP